MSCQIRARTGARQRSLAVAHEERNGWSGWASAGRAHARDDLLSNRPLGQRNDDRWPTRRQTTASKLTATVTATTTTFDAHRRQAASLYSAAARLTLRSATPEKTSQGLRCQAAMSD